MTTVVLSILEMGALGPGVLAGADETGPEEIGATPEGTVGDGARHLVQMVEVDVRVTVEIVVPVVTMEEPLVVIVLVTGQVVTVV